MAETTKQDSFLTHCLVTSRDGDEPIFVYSKDHVFCRLDRYVVLPVEDYQRLLIEAGRV